MHRVLFERPAALFPDVPDNSSGTPGRPRGRGRGGRQQRRYSHERVAQSILEGAPVAETVKATVSRRAARQFLLEKRPSDGDEFTFPPTLNECQRAIIHRIAAQMGVGLTTQSAGEGAARALMVRRYPRALAPPAAVPAGQAEAVEPQVAAPRRGRSRGRGRGRGRAAAADPPAADPAGAGASAASSASADAPAADPPPADSPAADPASADPAAAEALWLEDDRRRLMSLLDDDARWAEENERWLNAFAPPSPPPPQRQSSASSESVVDIERPLHARPGERYKAKRVIEDSGEDS